jgi:hypothetical protein
MLKTLMMIIIMSHRMMMNSMLAFDSTFSEEKDVRRQNLRY